MRQIEGIELRTLPVHDLQWVKDLEHFDGPLLSLFRHRRRGDNYLYYWCDSDGDANRWMILRVSETSVVRMANRLIPMNQVIPKGCQDDFVYFADLDAAGRAARVCMTQLEDIPPEYVPAAGAFLSAAAEERAGTYTILIERNLSIPVWGKLLADFSKAYAFLYNLVRLKAARIKSHPWQGNFSLMHFWRELSSFVPAEDTPEMESMAYASPGFIRYKLDSGVASAVGDLVALYREQSSSEEPSPIDEAVKNLEAYIRTNKLRNVDDPKASLWFEHNPMIGQLTEVAVRAMAIPFGSEFLSAARRPYEAAMMTMAFYKRVRQLADMEADRLVQFPSQRAALLRASRSDGGPPPAA